MKPGSDAIMNAERNEWFNAIGCPTTTPGAIQLVGHLATIILNIPLYCNTGPMQVDVSMLNSKLVVEISTNMSMRKLDHRMRTWRNLRDDIDRFLRQCRAGNPYADWETSVVDEPYQLEASGLFGNLSCKAMHDTWYTPLGQLRDNVLGEIRREVNAKET